MWLGGRRQLAKGDLPMLAVHVVFSTTARDLGLTLDQERNLSEHVNLITRSCYYQLRQLRVVMRSLSHDAAVVLVHAFVTSRIDHSCSVLVGLPLGLVGRLDRVLRSAACLIGHIPKYASVSAYMRDVLHWLPVSQRILYRISALVWRTITGCAPIGACIELEGGVLECPGTDRQKSATGEFWAGHTSAGQILRTPQKGIIWDLFAEAQ